MLRIKTLTLSILISIAVPWDWIEHDGNYIDRSRVVITLSSDRAPKLGQEPPIELDRQLDIFQGIDTERINIFKPLFTGYESFGQRAWDNDMHRYYVIDFHDGTDIFAMKDALERNDSVDIVEFSHRVEMLTPNDQYYSSQWAHNNTGQASNYNGGTVGTPGCDIDTDMAWELTTGDPSVVIAILDTGVKLNHEEFFGRVVSGYDFINNDTNATDDQGHGTACAGIAAAKGDNSDGVAGICWDCSIMPVKVLDSAGYGDDTTIADAVQWSSNNGASIISMSLGGGPYVSYFDSSINYATDNGTVVFAASGNDNAENILYPANYSNSIAVGALSPCNERKSTSSCDGEYYWGSNYGSDLDFVAPGVRIHTTTSSGGYMSDFNGTSSACPHAAGVAGLILSSAPYLTPEQVRLVMQLNAVDIGSVGFDNSTGHGRINAYYSILNLLNSPEISTNEDYISIEASPEIEFDEVVTIYNNGEAILDYSIDEFGYKVKDSDDGAIEYSWIDISANATTLSFNHNDDASSQQVDLDFAFPFYDDEYSSFIVSPNGWIGFGGDNNAWENSSIPSSSAPRPAIFGFWDDLNPVNSANSSDMSGYVRYHTDENRAVVWYDDVVHWVGSGSTTGTYNFQIVLHKDGSINLNYSQMDGSTNSATIGMQNADGSVGTALAINSEYAHSQLSSSITPRAKWLGISPLSGLVEQGGSQDLELGFNTYGLEAGTYQTEIEISSNDYENPVLGIPVTLTILDDSCNTVAAGDVTLDGVINILDVILLVNFVLGVDSPSQECQDLVADINADGVYNITDIVALINIILE